MDSISHLWTSKDRDGGYLGRMWIFLLWNGIYPLDINRRLTWFFKNVTSVDTLVLWTEGGPERAK